MTDTHLRGLALVRGTGEGAILASDVALSFWGGIDPHSAQVIDQHHPLNGEILTGKVVLIPNGRGSCSGSGVMLEMLLNGKAPAAMVFENEEHILPLSVIVAEEVFHKSIPMLRVSSSDFAALAKASWARVEDNCIQAFTQCESQRSAIFNQSSKEYDISDTLATFKLSEFDKSLLAGDFGKAAQAALRVILRMSIIQNATELIDITQAHIDGCVYTGNATLLFAEQLCAWGARVRVPSTMNSISVDQRRWRAQGLDPSLAVPASQLADAYVRMGCQGTFTCAPYLLNTAPAAGEQVVWAESNAVVYANSVLGAKTMKYPDFMDIFVALTGRAPNAGCHREENRLATLVVSIQIPEGFDDALFPLLGYLVGSIARHEIPLVDGVDITFKNDDLKAFGAAFATTSSAPMFHISGITVEAKDPGAISSQMSNAKRTVKLTREDIFTTWVELNGGLSPLRTLDIAPVTKIDLISLGNPHFSFPEFSKLAELCQERTKSKAVALIVTCGRSIYQQASDAGLMDKLEKFGVQVITDTCWCMIVDPVIPRGARCIMTNSGKYAHYGAGLTGRRMRFGSMLECVEAACSGKTSDAAPSWLQPRTLEHC